MYKRQINAMGISKALMEKVAIAKGRELGEGAATTICCTRYGNVMASRGSVTSLFQYALFGREGGHVQSAIPKHLNRRSEWR